MKRFLASVMIILCAGTSSLAGDVYGCIINETPASYHGSIASEEHQFDFDVQGHYIWCTKVPEGNYSVRSIDGTLDQNFTASGRKVLGLVGDENLHWLIKIKEQEKEK